LDFPFLDNLFALFCRLAVPLAGVGGSWGGEEGDASTFPFATSTNDDTTVPLGGAEVPFEGGPLEAVAAVAVVAVAVTAAGEARASCRA
jgi:hypothetical protein